MTEDKTGTATIDRIGVTPLGRHVVIRPAYHGEHKRPSGLIVPEVRRERAQTGIVEAIGPGEMDNGEWKFVDLPVGARVIFSRFGGTEIERTTDEQVFLVLHVRDIFGVITAHEWGD